jgi:hypothetical protein
LDRRLGGPQSWSGCGGEKKIPSPCQVSNPPIVHKNNAEIILQASKEVGLEINMNKMKYLSILWNQQV